MEPFYSGKNPCTFASLPRTNTLTNYEIRHFLYCRHPIRDAGRRKQPENRTGYVRRENVKRVPGIFEHREYEFSEPVRFGSLHLLPLYLSATILHMA